MDLQDRFVVIKKKGEKNMNYIEKEELESIIGGVNISAALFSALSRAANTILDAGRAFGSALRRLSSNDLCACK